MRNRVLVSIIAFMATSLVAGCSLFGGGSGDGGGSGAVERNSSINASPGPGRGCVQGTIINGITGSKIDIASQTGPGVFVLIRGARYKANVVMQPAAAAAELRLAEGDEEGEEGGEEEYEYEDEGEALPNEGEAALAGEYFICDVPVDESYLIFAVFDGYLPFQSEVKITSTTLSADEDDIAKADPLLLANIRVFSKGQQTKPLKITVFNEGKAVEGAIVRVEPGSANAFDKNGFLGPSDSRLVPLANNISDSDGYVEFDAGELVLGATYQYKVIPPADSNMQVAQGEFVLGVSTTGSNANNFYEFSVDLATAFEQLAIVSCSNQSVDNNKDGQLIVVLNRPVIHVNKDRANAFAIDDKDRGGDGSVDSIVLVEHADDSDNKAESVDVKIEGNIITLKAKLEEGTPSKSEDAGLGISYDFEYLFFKVKDGSPGDKGQAVSLSSMNVGPVEVVPEDPATDPVVDPATDPAVQAIDLPFGPQPITCPTTVYLFPYVSDQVLD